MVKNLTEGHSISIKSLNTDEDSSEVDTDLDEVINSNEPNIKATKLVLANENINQAINDTPRIINTYGCSDITNGNKYCVNVRNKQNKQIIVNKNKSSNQEQAGNDNFGYVISLDDPDGSNGNDMRF